MSACRCTVSVALWVPVSRGSCTLWPSRRDQGKICGKRESDKDVVEVQSTFHLRKQCVSQYITSRLRVAESRSLSASAVGIAFCGLLAR
jgi:hypothetical protein